MATFLRNNFNKRSVTLDLKSPEGVEIFLELAKGFDIVAENPIVDDRRWQPVPVAINSSTRR